MYNGNTKTDSESLQYFINCFIGQIMREEDKLEKIQ
jgi:hypothetical protein